jgi:hypothetical protein
MFIRKSLFVLALAASCALAALPSTMLFQGNMVVDGKPLSGNKELKVSLYDALTAGKEVWTKTYAAMFNNGYYTVLLDGLADVDFSMPLFVGLSIGTEVSPARIPLTTAPYAKHAEVADRALLADKATAATTATMAEGLVSATDKSVALKDGNGKTQLTLEPNGGITVGSAVVYPGFDGRGPCDLQNAGRMILVYLNSNAGQSTQLQICMQESATSYVWQRMSVW